MALRGEGEKWQFTDQSVTLELLYERRRNEGMIFATCWSGYTFPSTAHDVILSFHDVVCFCFLCINICFIWLRCILSFYLILCIYEFWIADMFFYYIILAKKKEDIRKFTFSWTEWPIVVSIFHERHSCYYQNNVSSQ
jgi:hypothetical protein